METLRLFFEQYAQQSYFGNTIQQYLLFLGIFAGFLASARVVYYFFKKYVRRLTSKTKTNLDDIFIDKFEEPIVGVIVLVGLYLAAAQLVLVKWLDTSINILVVNGITILFAWFLIRFLDALAQRYTSIQNQSTDTLQKHVLSLIRLVLKYSLIVLTTIIVLSNFGYNVSSLLASLGLGGLAMALASQEVLRNIFSGFVIMFDQPFRLGEWVIINNTEGTVQSIGLRSTRLKTFRGEYVTIPNHLITESMITNFSAYPDTRDMITIGLTYDTTLAQLQQAKNLIKEALDNAPGVVRDSYEINFTQFNAYSLDLFIAFETAIANPRQKRDIRDAFHKQVKERFDAAGISIAFPTQTIELKTAAQTPSAGRL
jgi:MscS family membrane protein